MRTLIINPRKHGKAEAAREFMTKYQNGDYARIIARTKRKNAPMKTQLREYQTKEAAIRWLNANGFKCVTDNDDSGLVWERHNSDSDCWIAYINCMAGQAFAPIYCLVNVEYAGE